MHFTIHVGDDYNYQQAGLAAHCESKQVITLSYGLATDMKACYRVESIIIN